MLLNSNFKNKKFIKYFQKYFGKHVDTIQGVLIKKAKLRSTYGIKNMKKIEYQKYKLK